MLDCKEDDKIFYFIEWTIDGERYTNHYFTNIINIDYKKYLSAIEKCGYNLFDEE